MTAAEQFAIYRFVITCLMIFGGVACVWYGYKLFSTGSGLYKVIDKLAIKRAEFNVSVGGMSAGAVLMVTSGLWGYFAYSSVPRLEMAQGTTKIVEPAKPIREDSSRSVAKDILPITETRLTSGSDTVPSSGVPLPSDSEQTRLTFDLPVPAVGMDVVDAASQHGKITQVVWSGGERSWQAIIAKGDQKVAVNLVDLTVRKKAPSTVIGGGGKLSTAEVFVNRDLFSDNACKALCK